MRRISKNRHEEQLAYQREYQRLYYWQNREKIRQNYLNAKAQQAKTTKKHYDNEAELYEDWNEQLRQRLANEDLEGWTRWAIQVTIDENEKMLQKLKNDTLQKEKNR